MDNIKKHIKENTYRKAYLLYGEEDYLKLAYKNRLKSAIAGDDSMNCSYFQGKDINVQEIIDTGNTLPFFAERRLIIIENSGFMKTSQDALVSAIKESPESTYYIFVESEVDKRSKMFKTVSSMGYACEMKTPAEKMLNEWVADMFTREGKKITRECIEYFLIKTGNDMNNIRNEAEKVISYAMERDAVDSDDIDAVCTVQTVDRIFDMINAVSERNKDKVVRLYSDLAALKEPPMKILVLTGRQFATLMAVREMHINGYGNSQIAERLGIRPYFVGRYINQAKMFSANQLRSAVEECVEAEHMIKSGQMEDTYAVEMILMKLSNGEI